MLQGVYEYSCFLVVAANKYRDLIDKLGSSPAAPDVEVDLVLIFAARKKRVYLIRSCTV